MFTPIYLFFKRFFSKKKIKLFQDGQIWFWTRSSNVSYSTLKRGRSIQVIDIHRNKKRKLVKAITSLRNLVTSYTELCMISHNESSESCCETSTFLYFNILKIYHADTRWRITNQTTPNTKCSKTESIRRKDMFPRHYEYLLPNYWSQFMNIRPIMRSH